jgi:hypothetical protein
MFGKRRGKMSVASGRLSDLVFVRLHRRAAEYAAAPDAERASVAAACRREATVGDLAERILQRTIYAQSASALGPVRELIQNALDASPRGGRVEVRSAMPTEGGDREVTVSDHGRGMTRAELLEDLLVPFRSGKADDPEAIGEHGIGFLSALELAPRVEVVSVTGAEGSRLSIEPVGGGPPYADFSFSLATLEPQRRAAPGAMGTAAATGTTVRLLLDHPVARPALAQAVGAVAGLVDPAIARIMVNGEPANTARARMRRVARVPVGQAGELGDLTLYAGQGDGIASRFTLTQKGLLVATNIEPFGAPALALHRELHRALAAAGYGLAADLPLTVPLTKGRAAVAAIAARAVEAALVTAFERFVLEDALYDRELYRGVDHRLGAVLDRLVNAALAGEPSVAPKAAELSAPKAQDAPAPPAEAETERKVRAPTVAAPEEVVRFAGVLVDAPLFAASTFDAVATGGAAGGAAGARGEVRFTASLRAVVEAHRAGKLSATGYDREPRPGVLYLSSADPLAQALFRRLTTTTAAPAAADAAARAAAARPMHRVSRAELLAAADLPGVPALAGVLGVLERIDAAISAASSLATSAVSVHQDLYGPDEMAHTDGTGISVNLASPRIRALLGAVLSGDDATAFGALVDLLLHEKAHVSLAGFVPRSCAEHGVSFYRRKDQLRARLLDAIASGDVLDPCRLLPAARRGLASVDLPSTEVLAGRFAGG